MYVKQRVGYLEGMRPPEDGLRSNSLSSLQPRRLCRHFDGAEKEKQADLEILFGKVIRRRTDRLRVDSRIPEELGKDFTQSIDSYRRTAPALLAKSARQAAQTHQENPGQALSDFSADLLAQTDRLHNIQMVHGTILQQYLIILQEREEENYLFISEKSGDTCEDCESLHGQLFSKKDLAQGGRDPAPASQLPL